MTDDTERLDGPTERIGSAQTQRPDDTFQPALGLQSGFHIAGRYKVKGNIGYGGESDVFLCEDTEDQNSLVVVKLYRFKLEPDVEIVKKLLGLEHPDIIRVLKVGEFNNRFFEVSEYAAGGTLDGLKLDEETLEKTVLRQVMSAFRFCHPLGIIHRDIKPQNLMYRDKSRSDIVVADFGLAALLPPDVSLRLSERAGKTELYAAPELIASQGQAVGVEVDYYALGMTLLVLLWGREPYQAGTPIEQQRIDKIQGAVPIPEYCSERFESLLKGLLHPNRKKRWGLEQVESWLRNETVVVPEIDQVVHPSHFEFEFNRGVFAHSIEELAKMLLDNPDRGKELVEEGLVADALVSCGRQATGLELRKIVKASKNQDVNLVYTIYALDPTLPYRFQRGDDIKTPQELAKIIDRDDYNRAEGERQLYNDMILTWLKLTNHNALVAEWEKMKSNYQTKKRQGLEVFLHILDPMLPYPTLKVEPKSINFGRVEVDTARTATIRITNTGRGYLSGRIMVDGAGVRVTPETFEGNSNEINLHFTAKELPVGREANIKINIESTIGSDRTISVPVTAKIGYPIFTNLSLFFDSLIRNGTIAFILVAGVLLLLMPLFEPAFADKDKAVRQFADALAWEGPSGETGILVALLIFLPMIIWNLLVVVLYIVGLVLLAAYEFYILPIGLGYYAASALKERIRNGKSRVEEVRGLFFFLMITLILASSIVVISKRARIDQPISQHEKGSFQQSVNGASPGSQSGSSITKRSNNGRTNAGSTSNSPKVDITSDPRRPEISFTVSQHAKGESEGSVPVEPPPKPSPRPLPAASVLSGKWQVLLPRSSGSETQDRIEMTLSNQSSTSLSGERFYIKGSGGTGDRIEIKGSWDPAQRRVELKESMDSSKPWEAATRGIFIGTLSEDDNRLDGEWTPYSGAVATRSFKRVR